MNISYPNFALVTTLTCSLLFSTGALAEPQTTDPLSKEQFRLTEMSDESLADLDAKEGITIDIEFAYKIGEIAWLLQDDSPRRNRYSGSRSYDPSTPAPPPVTFNVGGQSQK